MNGIVYRSGHKSPATYDTSKYKIIFTMPTLLGDTSTTTSGVLSKTIDIHPYIEVWVDVEEGTIIDIKEMPDTIKYDGIPEAIY